MDGAFVGENKMRSRSFRQEDYSTRRVFLRSYPLQWSSGDDRSEEETVMVVNGKPTKTCSTKTTEAEDERTEEESSRSYREKAQKKPIKNIVLSVYHWGEGKIIILRRLKHKVAVYAFACISARKHPTALISA